ncbi:MAG TPA: BREX-3 system phosphatase PglZ [Methanosarcinales archaeon]|nr:BREX-3 system phosphatase PglZ [Methanosarcinales archaeon]
MTDWRNQVLEEVMSTDSKLVVVFDPDDILQEEKLLVAIRDSGYEVIPYSDPVAFRYTYESAYRQRWDSGEETEKVILQIKSTDRGKVPYDLLKAGKEVSIGIHQIFSKLSYPIVEKLGKTYFDDLYLAYRGYEGERLGDSRTNEFILEKVYGIRPDEIQTDVDLFRTLLELHYRRVEIPEILVEYFLDRLNTDMIRFPLKSLFSSEVFFRFLQEKWGEFLRVTAAGEDFEIPFGDADLRVYIDTLFLEGQLKPVEFAEHHTLPEWTKVGVVIDPSSDARRRFERLLDKLKEKLPDKHSRYKDWQHAAMIWAEAVYLRYNLERGISEDTRRQFEELHAHIELLFEEWILRNYGTLSNQPYLPRPVMVHHIPHYIASKPKEKVALIIIDGLALDQWLIIRDELKHELYFEEDLVYAWVPTLTSISRRSIFAGEPPQHFENTLLDTNKEERDWMRFWKDNDHVPEEVSYKRGIKLSDPGEVEQILDDPRRRILGLVVNTVDEFMHHAQMGTLEMHRQVRAWVREGYLKELIDKLLDGGFAVYITADHGNVCATGKGEPKEGVLVEQRGKRSRVYDNPTFVKRAAKAFPESIRWSDEYLTPKYPVLIAGGLTAFAREGEKVVAHGGISVEEVLVPFIRVYRGE